MAIGKKILYRSLGAYTILGYTYSAEPSAGIKNKKVTLAVTKVV